MWRNKGEREKKERERKRKEKKRKGIGQRKENGDRAVTTLSYIPVYNLPLSLASQLGAASQLSAASELSPAAKLSKLWKYGGTCSPSPCSPAMKLSKYFLEVPTREEVPTRGEPRAKTVIRRYSGVPGAAASPQTRYS